MSPPGADMGASSIKALVLSLEIGCKGSSNFNIAVGFLLLFLLDLLGWVGVYA